MARQGLGRIKRLGKVGRMKGGTPRLADAGGAGGLAFVDLTPPQERELARRLGDRPQDRRLAKRLLRLQEQFPQSSLPELVVLDWLRRRGVPHTYQGTLLGGRAVRGGLVPDFVVRVGGEAYVWEVQGQYWHTQIGQRSADMAKRMRYLGQVFDGLRITRVVYLWEDDIYRRRPTIFRLAMAGIGLRG